MVKKLSIIVPVYNEERTIGLVLEKLNKNKIENIDFEIIVINDGSYDNTQKILDEKKALYTKLITNPKNFGKGYSVKKGIEHSTGEFVIFQDADLEYDPIEFKKFIKIFNEFNADGIIGSRFIYSEYTRSHNYFHKIGNNIITFFFNILYNTTFTDIYSCYFAFKKELLNPKTLSTTGFEQHAEILCKVVKNGKKFYEVPISYRGRSINEGKKIKWYHFFSVLFQIIVGKF